MNFEKMLSEIMLYLYNADPEKTCCKENRCHDEYKEISQLLIMSFFHDGVIDEGINNNDYYNFLWINYFGKPIDGQIISGLQNIFRKNLH